MANEKLVECRRVLKYTYVFGYYLPEGSARKRLFEHHQVSSMHAARRSSSPHPSLSDWMIGSPHLLPLPFPPRRRRQQENLEKFTEHLSWLSEQSLDEFKSEGKRSEVVNYTRVTETFLRNLVKSVEDGLGDDDEEVAAAMAASGGGGGGGAGMNLAASAAAAGGGAAASSAQA